LADSHRVTGKRNSDVRVFKSRKRFRRGTGVNVTAPPSGSTTTSSGGSSSGSSPSFYYTTTSGYGSDGSWSYFMDYKEEIDQYVKDEWNQRVTKFQSEFQKNPR
jgi:hypothetical protein